MSAEVRWRSKTREVAAHPLFAEAPTRAALDAPESPVSAPNAVYFGIGLCTRHRMAVGLPLDVLGMLLPAERLRAAVGAERLVVLVADAHARANGFDAAEVERRAQAVSRALLRVKVALGLERLCLLRASALQVEPGYQAELRAIRAAAQGSGNEYMYRQTADVAFLDRELGGLLKLGWTVDVDGTAGGRRDEVAFDALVAPWSGRSPAFAYVRCGRALDDRRPKVAPYVGVDRTRRLYLDPSEPVARKLARAQQIASRRNAAAVHEHLSLVADAWGAPGEGLAARLETILRALYPGRGPQAEPLRLDDVRPAARGGLAVADGAAARSTP